MTKFEQIKKDIILQLVKADYSTGDLTDIGNEVGMAIAKYTMEENSQDNALDIDSFISGIRHGISIIDGTH